MPEGRRGVVERPAALHVPVHGLRVRRDPFQDATTGVQAARAFELFEQQAAAEENVPFPAQLQATVPNDAAAAAELLSERLHFRGGARSRLPAGAQAEDGGAGRPDGSADTERVLSG